MTVKDLPKYFNVTGQCVSSKHYMVDTSAKIDMIVNNYIERGEYFTINRSRQFGKTTTLNLLKLDLADDYLVIYLSFKGKESWFDSNSCFERSLCAEVRNQISSTSESLAAIWNTSEPPEKDPRDLRDRIEKTCAASQEPVVFIVDDLDSAANYCPLDNLLGILRDLFNQRFMQPTFHSVVLASTKNVEDVKDELRPDDYHHHNIPWNIAANFTVDLSFSVMEIATMLEAFEQDHQTGMDIAALSERLYYYTSGYPFLVSRLCKTIDEAPLEWTVQGVDDAVSLLLNSNNTLFDDLKKNVRNNKDLFGLVRDMMLNGYEVGFDLQNPAIELGAMFGIISGCNGKASVSNVIFESILYRHLSAISGADTDTMPFSTESSQFFKDGLLDMDAVCTRFAAFMRSEYRDEDGKFIEQHARLLFLAFLKPIINGTGHFAVEPETRASKRMDVVVFYKHREYIVELKIWRGEQYERQGIEQLAGYLKSRDAQQGWLISFCDLIKQPREGGKLEIDGHTINETIIAYKDKTKLV